MALRVPCPQCGKVPPPDCDCPPLPPGPPPEPASPPEAERPPASREWVQLRREKRRGREVIVIEGLPDDAPLAEYAKALKRRCGCGGSVKGRAILIQGDHRETIEGYFREHGYRTKRSGG